VFKGGIILVYYCHQMVCKWRELVNNKGGKKEIRKPKNEIYK